MGGIGWTVVKGDSRLADYQIFPWCHHDLDVLVLVVGELFEPLCHDILNAYSGRYHFLVAIQSTGLHPVHDFSEFVGAEDRDALERDVLQ